MRGTFLAETMDFSGRGGASKRRPSKVSFVDTPFVYRAHEVAQARTPGDPSPPAQGAFHARYRVHCNLFSFARQSSAELVM